MSRLDGGDVIQKSRVHVLPPTSRFVFSTADRVGGRVSNRAPRTRSAVPPPHPPPPPPPPSSDYLFLRTILYGRGEPTRTVSTDSAASCSLPVRRNQLFLECTPRRTRRNVPPPMPVLLDVAAAEEQTQFRFLILKKRVVGGAVEINT